MEIARGFASLPRPPRRSVLFLAVTAEEAGLLGSDYFVHYPTVPVGQIIANINIDGGTSLFPSWDVIAWGEEHSSLGPLAREIASRVGFDISPDPFPEEVIFIRSDQYSFVRAGVPSVFPFLGVKSRDPTVDGLAILRKWLATNYHSPKDDTRQPINFESSERFARFALALGYRVAMASSRPSWNRGDFFGEKFGRTRSRAAP